MMNRRATSRQRLVKRFRRSRMPRVELLENRELLSIGGSQADALAGGIPRATPSLSTDSGYALGQASTATGQAQGSSQTSNNVASRYEPGVILVGFDGNVASAYAAKGAAAALETAGRLVAADGLQSPSVLFNVPAAAGHPARVDMLWHLPAGQADPQAIVARLAGQPGIAFAEPDGIATIQAIDPGLSSSPPSGWPFGSQEHLVQIHAADYDTGASASNAWGTTMGAGVVVGVVDTGIDLDHPDLDNSLDTVNGSLVGANFVTTTASPQDDNGHGTHVAGIIAAELGNLNDLANQATSSAWAGGTVGVAPAAKVMPVKVLNANGGGTNDAVAQGIRFAADNGAQIISMSFGGGFSQTIKDAVDYAYSVKNVLLIAAAGNGYSEGADYPAAYDDVLAVGAVDKNDVKPERHQVKVKLQVR